MNRKTILRIGIIAGLIGCHTNPENPKTETKATDTIKNMDSKENYTSTFTVAQSPEKAFNAIMEFRSWWSEEIEGYTDKLNETFFYHYKDVHLCKVKLVEIVPQKRLVYQVMENEFSFVKDKTEWVNSKLIFEISSHDNTTEVKFTHEGLNPEHECYSVCEDAWTSYIQGSLKSLIETGVGKPNPKEGGLNEELVKKWGLPDK